MNALTKIDEDDEPFFAPVPTDELKGLISIYEHIRARMEHLAATVNNELDMGAISYFLNGCSSEGRGYSLTTAADIFKLETGLAALDAAYWQQAMTATDIIDYMPTKRRDEWNNNIRDMTCPTFSEEAVRATIGNLLMDRPKFLAEKVDGIFQNLSGTHVTNKPDGFSKRMIIADILNKSNGYYWENYSKIGYLNDLRQVIAKIRGFPDAFTLNGTGDIITRIRKSDRFGEWEVLDGGALKIRLYKVGTMHAEIHPDISWRLNKILAFLHPAAIPASFRQRPKKAVKDVELLLVPLPIAALSLLGDFKIANNTATPPFQADRKSGAYRVAISTLEALGGVVQPSKAVSFEYDPTTVIREVIRSGVVPDKYTHQYYPTPEEIAVEAVAAADIQPDDLCLEPSAGTGAIARFMPRDRTQCVEVSVHRTQALRSMGFECDAADFLTWSSGEKFDKIVMNPPFSQGRWKAHVERALWMLADGGCIVAVLPDGAKGWCPEGGKMEVIKEYNGAFKGTSINTILARISK